MSDKGVGIVTGASSGIGLAISRRLSKEGYRIYGIGRNFSEGEKEPFLPVILDLLDTRALEEKIREIRQKEDISLLICNAGVGYYGPHEELNTKKIQEMTRTNLEIPMLLTQILLRDIKKQKGNILFISSVTALQSSPHGCAYGATKAGITGFAESLFDEVRKYDVGVTVIHPDMTDTELYRNADFTCEKEEGAYLEPEEVAETVSFVLSGKKKTVLTSLTIRPQYHKIKKK